MTFKLDNLDIQEELWTQQEGKVQYVRYTTTKKLDLDKINPTLPNGIQIEGVQADINLEFKDTDDEDSRLQIRGQYFAKVNCTEVVWGIEVHYPSEFSDGLGEEIRSATKDTIKGIANVVVNAIVG